MKLSDLPTDGKGVITKIAGRGAFRKRLTEMGFVKGKEILVVKNAPLKDPIEYSLLGYEVSLRRSEAQLIEIVSLEEALRLNTGKFEGVIESELLKTSATEKSKTINIAFVGNPNCGKTTLFNEATGAQEHVGNYSGVTVDAKKAKFKHGGYTFNVTDLPGTYSISAYTPEEVYVRDYILNENPDVVINVADSSNLERNLFLTTQLIDMDIKVILALNMYDDFEKKGDRFEHEELGNMVGIPMVPTVGAKGKGLKELFDKTIEVYEDRDPSVRHIHINYGKEVEQSIEAIQVLLRTNPSLTDKVSSRYLAINLLQGEKGLGELLTSKTMFESLNQIVVQETIRLKGNYEEEPETLITDAKYGFINGALKETYHESGAQRVRRTKLVDGFITHKVWGFPIFIFFMWFMFQATFTVGQIPMDLIDSGVAGLGNLFSTYMPDGVLKDLIVDGIIGGVGGVIIFLPNILILFFFISLMEDTGYMARAAFIMDKIMHKIGLHGKSFIPLIMGFGCNVPAIMATRTLENKNDRLLTMLINPFMSCSARLPVYVLIIAAFFPDRAGTVLFSIYILGIVMAALTALLFKKTLFHTKEAPFVMELPPYRMPTINTTMRHMWTKAVQYLQKMGGVILVASILIWALGYYPKASVNTAEYDQKIATLKKQHPSKEQQAGATYLEQLHQLKIDKEADRQAHSYIGSLGRFVTPVLKPLGFDWKMTVSIITGMAAKEIVVSTMGVLYQADDEADENSETLISKLQNQTIPDGVHKGEKLFTPLKALSFLIFILIYFPCVAVVAAVKKESGSWKWAAFIATYTTGLAWVLSFIVFQVGSLLF